MKLFALAALAALLSSAPVTAQVNEKFADLASEIEMVRSMVQTERKTVVTDNLVLTAEENQKFWPIYNQYRSEAASAQDKRVKLVTDFAAQYETLSDEQARKLLDEYLSYQAATLKVRQRYLGKFSKALPGKKLARFFQIENRLDALTELTIASHMPLVR